jgi:rRNA-processing protein FCF1
MIAPLELLRKYGHIGIVVDSNLLLLLFLGTFDRKQIETNSRLSTFTQDDFDLLRKLLDGFKLIVTTPHILTEVSNLSNAIPEPKREAYFASFLAGLSLLDEQHVKGSTALTNRWARFGLTDAAIAVIAKNRYLVVTDDFRLSQSLRSDGVDTLNFNHLRDAYWQMLKQ